jgi:hypothetical protein
VIVGQEQPRQMAPWKKALLWIGATIAALPLALILTILLWPFWNWFELVSGIESLGHSGPAAWCFGAVYGFISFVIFTLGWYSRKKRIQPPAPTRADGT